MQYDNFFSKQRNQIFGKIRQLSVVKIHTNISIIMYHRSIFFFLDWIHLESHPPTFMYPYLLSIDCLAQAVLYAQNIKIYKMFTVIYITVHKIQVGKK